MVEARCMKCKKQREMINITQTKTKRGTPMKKGECKVCGTKMCRLGG